VVLFLFPTVRDYSDIVHLPGLTLPNEVLENRTFFSFYDSKLNNKMMKLILNISICFFVGDKRCSANYSILKFLIDGCKDPDDEKTIENLKAVHYFWKSFDLNSEFEKSFRRFFPSFTTENIDKFNSEKDSDIKFIVEGEDLYSFLNRDASNTTSILYYK